MPKALRETLDSTPQVAPQVTPQVVKLLRAIGTNERLRSELQERLGLSDRKSFRESYLAPALDAGLIEFTIPAKPNSRLQAYRLTETGKAVLMTRPREDPGSLPGARLTDP